jgi:site-specific recombinase XerD
MSGHTYATIALDSGVDLKIASERLGHASMNATE